MTDYIHALRPRMISGLWSIQGTAPCIGRVRKRFPSKEIAEFESMKLITLVRNQLSNGEVRQTLLTKEQEKDASLAFNLLNDECFKGFSSLLDVVNFAKSKVSAEYMNITLKLASDAHLNDLKNRGRTQKYLNQVEDKLIRFCHHLGEDFLVQDVEKVMIRAWIRGQGNDLSPFRGKNTSNTTRSNELTFLKGFFNFCKGMDYIEVSPCEGVKSYGKNKKEVIALSVEKAGEMLSYAKEFSEEAYAYFALSLFAGLRPEELRPVDGQNQLNWSDFTFRDDGSKSTLEISYEVGKISTRRVVELPDNLVEILRPIAKEDGAVIKSSYAKWRGVKDYIRARAGYKVYGVHFRHIDAELSKIANDESRMPYVRDVLRHSAITYRLELKQNKDAVALWAGNSPAVIDQHYRALVKGTDKLDPRTYAESYFKLKG